VAPFLDDDDDNEEEEFFDVSKSGRSRYNLKWPLTNAHLLLRPMATELFLPIVKLANC
jgi:hypothetical protein